MDKRKIGSRVNTPYGCGTVVGYDLENSRAWRHQVKLDNDKLWGGEHPCFYHSEITDILSDQKPASNKDYAAIPPKLCPECGTTWRCHHPEGSFFNEYPRCSCCGHNFA